MSHLKKAATADMTAVLRALSVVASLTNTRGSVKSFLTASMTEEVSLACCSCDRVTMVTRMARGAGMDDQAHLRHVEDDPGEGLELPLGHGGGQPPSHSPSYSQPYRPQHQPSWARASMGCNAWAAWGAMTDL